MISNPALLIVIAVWTALTAVALGLPVWFYADGSVLAKVVAWIFREEQ